MNTEQLKKIFDENADCYSATINGYFSTVIGSAMSPDKFIEVVSELMNEIETKLKEPNFYIVNSKKYLNDEQRNSVAEKITQMSTDENEKENDDDFEDDYTFIRCSRCDGHDACEDFGCALSAGIKINEDIV